ncbi:MAG: Gfo/Idh/MocA family protein [Salinibacter sp.]
MSDDHNEFDGITRRDFVKRSTIATAGVSAGLMASGNFAYADGTDSIRLGLVGCGGRGTGAADNCVRSSDGVTLVAMGDLFQDRMEKSKETLSERLGDKFQVDRKHTFLGFDAYQKVIESDVDLVIFATPPAFRPTHLRAAIEGGKHVFIEKPVATDPTGIRSVMESAKMAEKKSLAIVAGTQRRHDPAYREAMKRIHNGAIGEVKTAQVYWNQGGLWNHERTPGMSDMEWQIRNWLYFTWLSGDHIVEQHVHNIDVANWALQSHPEKAIGVGGRQVRTDPSYGHIFDHFGIEFQYPSGARVYSMCRQQEGTPSRVEEHIIGTKGTSNGHSKIEGETNWTYEGEDVNPYVQEHADLIASIRKGEPLNEGQRVAESVLTAIMGREAAYTGQELTWDQIKNAEMDLRPETMEFGSLPFPDVAEPGSTKLARTPFKTQTADA